jgi:fatty-acyl-CoA synthase
VDQRTDQVAEFNPPYRDLTVGALLTSLARAIPEREALVYADRGLRLTFDDLEREARLVARGLMAIGVERGDRVAVWATNVPEWVILQFALAKIGAILVTVNTSLSANEVDYLLRQSETSTLFTIRGYRDVDYIEALIRIGAAEPIELPDLRRVIYLGEGDHPSSFLRYDELRQLAEEISEEQLDRRESGVGLDDVINMQYTSGTTGFPKGVMLSSRNIVNNGFWLGQGLGYTTRIGFCLCVPLFHCFGCVIGVLGAYTHARVSVQPSFFEARRVLEVISTERCTSVYGVPTMFLAEMEDPEFARFDLSSLRTGVMAGTLCPEQLMRTRHQGRCISTRSPSSMV